MFGDKNTARENGFRLVQYIDKVEAMTVVDYIVNALRSIGNELITKAGYYRILWGLSNSFPEDLYHFKKIATNNDVILGSTQIIALTQNGLMILAETDANKDIELQNYAVTTLGMMVDR